MWISAEVNRLVKQFEQMKKMMKCQMIEEWADAAVKEASFRFLFNICI